MSSDRPESPRSEPEIIPPERGEPRRSVKWTSYDERGTHRIYVTRLGPFSTIILILVLAAVVALFSLILIGAFLIWIPLVIVLIAIGVISAWWQGLLRR